MSYQEKSAWISLGATLVVFVPYFAYIFSLPLVALSGTTLVVGIAAVTAMIVITAVAHAAVALHAKDGRAERNAEIKTKSYRNAYLVLAVGALIVAAGVYLGSFNLALSANTFLLPLIANVIFLCFVLAEMTSWATKIVLYRIAN